jgi:hypothetical protein
MNWNSSDINTQITKASFSFAVQNKVDWQSVHLFSLASCDIQHNQNFINLERKENYKLKLYLFVLKINSTNHPIDRYEFDKTNIIVFKSKFKKHMI